MEKRQKSSFQGQGSCFVIMPFSDTANHTEEYWTHHFEYFLKPLIEENGFKAYRSEALRGDILDNIIKQLIHAQVVVADLTDLNPNVLWELGVRQSFKNGTITIAEYGISLPFDLGTKGTLFYNTSYHSHNPKRQTFINQFKEAIQDCITNPEISDSPVLKAISGRGSIFELIHNEENCRRIDALMHELSANVILYEKLINTLENNEQEPSNRKIMLTRFRYTALEILLSNRYLDIEHEKYEDLRAYYDIFWNLNKHMDSLEYSQCGNKKFLERIKGAEEKVNVIIPAHINKLIIELGDIRSDIIKRSSPY